MSIAYKVIAGLVLLIGSFFFGYHQGGLSAAVKDERAVIKQQSAEELRAHTDATTISQEAQTYAHAVSQAINEPDPAPAVVCVRKYAAPRPLSAPAAAGSLADAADRLPARADRPLQPITDISHPAVAIGARANAQIAGLKDYITRVCLTP